MIYDVNGNIIQNSYNVAGTLLAKAYDVNGNEIGEGGKDYSNYTVEHLVNINIANTQGFDIYDGTLFQFRRSGNIHDLVTTANISTGDIITADISITSDHGDSASFINEKYDPSDDFPLLMVSADTSPYIYVNRVTDSTASLVSTIYLPYNVAGYHAVGTYDLDNNIMYTVGTVKDDYLSDEGGTNPCIVCKWDVSNMTDNGDGTVTPELISTYQRPFIYVMQGEQFHDGYIWICSGYGNSTQYIYAMDPETGQFAYTLTMPITTEIEGISWQYADSDYYMIAGFQGGKYYTIHFE